MTSLSSEPGPLPHDMRELERRAWTLAGERMINEPLRSVLGFADATAENLMRDSVEDVADPVVSFFNAPLNERLAEVLSRYEWRAIVFAVLGWARAETIGEPAFIASLDGLEEAPPAARVEFGRWLLDHGLIGTLDTPLQVVAPLAPTHRSRHDALYTPRATLRDALDRTVQRRSAEELRVAATSFLAWLVGRSQREARYAKLAEVVIDEGPVAEAATRVRALIDHLRAQGVEAQPLPVAGTKIVFDEDGLTVSLATRDGTLSVSLIERHGERARSSLEDRRTRPASLPILLLLAERTWEALVDAEHPKNVALRAALNAPRWSRLLTELEREVQEEGEPEPPFPEGERLVFRVGYENASLVVEPAVQKARGRRFTKGRKVDWATLTKRGVPLDPRDARAVEAWLGLGGHRVEGTGAAGVLEALVAHPRVVWRGDSTLPLRVKRGALSVAVSDRAGESWIRFQLDDATLSPNELLSLRVDAHVARVEPERALVTVARLPESLRRMAEACARWETGLPSEADDVLLRLIARMPPGIGVRLPPRLRGEARSADLRPILRFAPLPGGGIRARFLMQPLPSSPPQLPGEGPTHLVGVEAGQRVHTVRDHAAERHAVEACVVTLGMDEGILDGKHTYLFEEPEAALDLLSAVHDHADLVRVEWPKNAQPWRMIGRAGWGNTKVRAQKAGEWFALRGEATLDEGKVALAQIMAALREGRRYVSLSKGRFAAITEELRASLEDAQDVVFEDGKELAVSTAAIASLEALLPEASFSPDKTWVALRARLRESASLEVGIPDGVEATLRVYQEEGIRWLLRVSSWAGGACLADDMGLGKTLQALALMRSRGDAGPALVVCPTSLSENWRRECARFTPGLAPRLYRGRDRGEVLDGLGARDVLIASFDVVTRDIDALAELRFSTVVFDEAHALKNPDAQRTRAARRITADFRLGLTGTPLENHLGELHSLFSVLVPGLLGSRRHFRARFAVPIERDADADRREALRTLLRPFLLRRTKDQVLTELPPRVEVVRAVDLSEDERALYEAERRSSIERLAERNGPNEGRFAVLAALTRLRRLACDPRLVDPETTVTSSSKLEAALELFEDLRLEGHRALVFSQFTTHLALVRQALRERGIDPLYLDGQTPAKKRAELVDAWQQGADPLFLISLKAGGSGLNLTAADTVVHLDPWWNPAVEDQASDRTHRIGQDKPVTVIRLVSQGTIEQTVVELHDQKRELSRAILEGAEGNARLTADDLLNLIN